MDVSDENLSFLTLLCICDSHLWFFAIFQGNRMPNLWHLQSLGSIVEDVCTLKCLQWCSMQRNFKKSSIKRWSDLENCIRFEISAKFYPVLMYHMSKSDKNWPIYEKLMVESSSKAKWRTARAADGAARYARNGGGREMGEPDLIKKRNWNWDQGCNFMPKNSISAQGCHFMSWNWNWRQGCHFMPSNLNSSECCHFMPWNWN